MRFARILTVLLTASLLLAGCTNTPSAVQSNPEPPRNARATLQAFFDAWQAEDEPTLEQLMTSGRTDLTWEFDALRRIEFGPIAEAPNEVGSYLTSGRGSTSGIDEADVAVFRADVTFYFEPGEGGSVADGDTQSWMWILVRGDDGIWLVDDWGY